MIFPKASLIGDMGSTVLKKANTADTQVEPLLQTHNDNDDNNDFIDDDNCDEIRKYVDIFAFSVL